MDVVFIAGIAALWAVTVLLAVGFEKLEKPAERRSS